MDFPAIERSYSHISTTLHPRHDSTDSEDSIPSTLPIAQDAKSDLADVTLAPITTQVSRVSLSRKVTRFTTHGTTYTSDPSFEVDWEDGDPENPRNWPLWYKSLCLAFISTSTLVVVLYSTAYTSAMSTIMQDFGLHDKASVTLGLTTYLVGLAVGSVLFAPISETYGRRPVYIVTMFIFTVLVVPCATAKDITTLVVVRFFGAVAGSSMIANAPGSIGDIISEEYRSIAFSIWSVGPMNAPSLGPIVGGYVVQYLGWRWLHWIVLMMAAVAFVMMCSLKETYAPTLLQARTKKLRRENGENRYWSRFDVKVGFWQLMKVNLSRPFIMAVKEPICIFFNIYIGIVYAILYLCFASYPIVYHDERGWSVGQSSLAFTGIAVGTMIVICSASPIKKMINMHKRDESGHLPPEAAMSIVCIAAILVPVGQLWFAWTCLPESIHPAISIAAGIPFGAGNGIIFIYASNYLVGSYGIYAASALAGNSVVRSVLGGVLPLAAAPLYSAMGANWAGTFLGLLEVIIIPIPFIFYRYGHRIRQKSSLIREMREMEEKQEKKRKRAEQQAVRTLERQMTNQSGMATEKGVEMVVEGEVDVSGPALEVTSMNKEQAAAAELSRVRGLIKVKHEEV